MVVGARKAATVQSVLLMRFVSRCSLSVVSIWGQTAPAKVLYRGWFPVNWDRVVCVTCDWAPSQSQSLLLDFHQRLDHEELTLHTSAVRLQGVAADTVALGALQTFFHRLNFYAFTFLE